jgi:hypothetical protein
MGTVFTAYSGIHYDGLRGQDSEIICCIRPNSRVYCKKTYIYILTSKKISPFQNIHFKLPHTLIDSYSLLPKIWMARPSLHSSSSGSEVSFTWLMSRTQGA